MKILCYGDSNTWGYDPRGYFGGRYNTPWPHILTQKRNWNILNQGENGREIPKFSIKYPGDLDLLIVMLGTNDLLQNNTAKAVAQRMEHFLESMNLERSKILLIAPPPIRLGEWVPTQKLIDASNELAKLYQALSFRLGVRFVNASDWNIPMAFDGVHFTEEGHRAFGEGLLDYFTKEGV